MCSFEFRPLSNWIVSSGYYENREQLKILWHVCCQLLPILWPGNQYGLARYSAMLLNYACAGTQPPGSLVAMTFVTSGCKIMNLAWDWETYHFCHADGQLWLISKACRFLFIFQDTDRGSKVSRYEKGGCSTWTSAFHQERKEAFLAEGLVQSQLCSTILSAGNRRKMCARVLAFQDSASCPFDTSPFLNCRYTTVW